MKKFRFHPSGDAIGELGHWGEALEAVGLDPPFDVDRAFVAAYHATDSWGIVLLELALDDERVAEALVRAGAKRAEGEPLLRATVRLRRLAPLVVALVRPGMLVVAPERFAHELVRLRVPSKLPAPDGRAAARLFAFDPSDSLGTRPTWPRTIVAAHAELEFTDEGGAIVRFFADSTTPEQAQKDAEALTKEAHDLLTLDLAIFEMHLLDPPTFTASGRRISMQSGLYPGDVDWILRYTGGP